MRPVQILHLAQVVHRGHHLDLVHSEQLETISTASLPGRSATFHLCIRVYCQP